MSLTKVDCHKQRPESELHKNVHLCSIKIENTIFRGREWIVLIQNTEVKLLKFPTKYKF